MLNLDIFNMLANFKKQLNQTITLFKEILSAGTAIFVVFTRIQFTRIKSIHSSQSFTSKMRVNIILYQIKQIQALITQRKK